MKSNRNKTIDFSLAEGKEYLSRCVRAEDYNGELDKTVIGDNIQALSKIKDGSIDLLIVDPPYNMNKSFHGNKFKETDDENYAEYTKKWLDEVLPKLKKTASVYVCCDWKSGLIIAPILKSRLILKNRITWEREKGRGAKSNWKNSMEDIYFATVGEEYTFNLEAVKVKKKVLAPYRENGKPKDWEETAEGKFRKTCPSNFWDDVSVPYWSMPENTAHPTQKPEKLIAKLILSGSNKGDTVLDIFAGSGTTGVVSKKLGRHYIDIEINPTYCAWAEKRLETAQKDSEIQGYKDGFFLPRNSEIKTVKKDV